MGYKPAIVVVAYRRLYALERLLNSIDRAYYEEDDIELIISIDYHDENHDVINYANGFEWKHGNKLVVTHKKNMGLRNHIIECGNYSQKYGSIILLEDDDYVSEGYYYYTKSIQDFFADDKHVAGVSLYGFERNEFACKRFQPIKYNYDTYFGQFSCTRGESWTKEQWHSFIEWYNENPEIKEDNLMPSVVYTWKKSWGKYFLKYLVETNKYYVVPYVGYSTVYGEKGTHSSQIELDVQVALSHGVEDIRIAPFDRGAHYDAFFENVDIKHALAELLGVEKEKIAVDLFGLENRVFDGKKYVLSTSRINRKIIKEYDLNMRPHEENVVLNMYGTGIFLYDNEVKKYNAKKSRRMNYDFAGMRGPYAIKYGVCHCAKVLANVTRKLIERIIR